MNFIILLATIVVSLLIFTSWNISISSEPYIISLIVYKLARLSAVFIPIGIYLTYTLFQQQMAKNTADATFQLIDRSWLNLNKILVDYYEFCPNFINSIGFEWQRKVLGEVKKSNKPDTWYCVNYITTVMFQSWEDLITGSLLDDTGFLSWISCFLQWANSPLLYKNWTVTKAGYSKSTQDFGDLLFYYARNNKINNTKDLNDVGEKMVNSEKFKNIIKVRFHN